MKVFENVAHPWHGISPGENAPDMVTIYIELVPLDTVKYEIDKTSGHLKIDRPQKYSSLCPTLYGFIPRTYCGELVAELARKSGKPVKQGDQDPLDICVLTEKTITRSGILVNARPVGGFRLLDKGEADDKIIAILKGDSVFSGINDVSELPSGLLDTLRHYFLTYKELPGESGTTPRVEIADLYGAETAKEVIRESLRDYRINFSGEQRTY